MKILNETYLQQRIEQLGKPIAYYDGIYVSDAQMKAQDELEALLDNCEEIEVVEVDEFSKKYALKCWNQDLPVKSQITDYMKKQGYKLIKTK